ncbi:unnamed protein product, partial [Prorocentrum cordatum]
EEAAEALIQEHRRAAGARQEARRPRASAPPASAPQASAPPLFTPIFSSARPLWLAPRASAPISYHPASWPLDVPHVTPATWAFSPQVMLTPLFCSSMSGGAPERTGDGRAGELQERADSRAW